MSTRSLIVALAACAVGVLAQNVPLADKDFDYNNLPYQADTDTGDRGTQFGYNRCNATTENQQSKCQTAIITDISDFCVWSSPEPNGVIGSVEGESVAWCTKPGRGTRLIPSGALTGVQFMKTPDYAQVVGFIDQSQINLQKDDGGGEMDPHGADQRGNPLGGLVFSSAFGSPNKQVKEWHNFMGSNMFCFKVCDPAGPNAAHYCEHVFDRIGCQYNAPAAYVDGVFESCEGESQDFPGVYTDAAGAVHTYTQPAESLGAIQTMPYTARIPKSSNCVAATSAAIYTGLPSGTAAAVTSAATSAAVTSGASSAAASGVTTTRASAATSRASGTASSSASASASANAASSVRSLDFAGVAAAGVFTLLGAVVGVALL